MEQDNVLLQLLERVAKLEEGRDRDRESFLSFSRESQRDRATLHTMLETLIALVEKRYNRQSGFLAGVMFVGTLLGALIASLWHKLLEWLAK